MEATGGPSSITTTHTQLYEQIRNEEQNIPLPTYSVESLKKLKTLNSTYLNVANQQFQGTLSKVDKMRKLILEVEINRVENLNERIDRLIEQDSQRRSALVKAEITKWDSIEDPAALNQAMRSFIMKMAKGEGGVKKSSYWVVFEAIRKETSNEKIITVINKPLFTVYELKTGTVREAPKSTIREQLEGPLQNKTPITLENPSQKTIEKLREERLWRLQNMETIYGRVVVDQETVSSSFFPQTEAWFVGSHLDDYSFEFEMQEIARENGIILITDSKKIEPDEQTVILDSSMRSCWPKDILTFRKGEIAIPVVREEEMGRDVIAKIIRGAREKENPKLWNQNTFATPSKVFKVLYSPLETVSIIGKPWLRDEMLQGVAFAEAVGVPCVMNLTYNEGGNTLIGSREDGTAFAIIGKDSYYFSKYLLEKDLGREMNDEEIKMAFGIDLGVSKDNITFVEQPGDFHLDMNMALVGPNTVVLNDAKQAVGIYKPTASEKLIRKPFANSIMIEKAHDAEDKKAAVKKTFEDQTEADLKAAGFEVVRFAGRFDYHDTAFRKPVMNFFNMVTATTPKGEKIIIGLGPENEEFKEKFMEMVKATNPDKVYFVHYNNSRHMLGKGGGVSCNANTV